MNTYAYLDAYLLKFFPVSPPYLILTLTGKIWDQLLRRLNIFSRVFKGNSFSFLAPSMGYSKMVVVKLLRCCCTLIILQLPLPPIVSCAYLTDCFFVKKWRRCPQQYNVPFFDYALNKGECLQYILLKFSKMFQPSSLKFFPLYRCVLPMLCLYALPILNYMKLSNYLIPRISSDKQVARVLPYDINNTTSRYKT